MPRQGLTRTAHPLHVRADGWLRGLAHRSHTHLEVVLAEGRLDEQGAPLLRQVITLLQEACGWHGGAVTPSSDTE